MSSNLPSHPEVEQVSFFFHAIPAGVNQQPPVHQFRMRPFKSFLDEPKHIQVGHFYFPLPLLPTSSPPKPKLIFSPPGLASFFSPPLLELQGELRNVKTQGSLGK